MRNILPLWNDKLAKKLIKHISLAGFIVRCLMGLLTTIPRKARAREKMCSFNS